MIPIVITLREIADIVHSNAWLKGFHDMDESADQFIERTCNNMHDEISELHEAWREGRLYEPCDKSDKMSELGIPALTCAEEELADIIIRAADSAKKLGIDIESAVLRKHAFNKTRPHRHGGKKS